MAKKKIITKKKPSKQKPEKKPVEPFGGIGGIQEAAAICGYTDTRSFKAFLAKNPSLNEAVRRRGGQGFTWEIDLKMLAEIKKEIDESGRDFAAEEKKPSSTERRADVQSRLLELEYEERTKALVRHADVVAVLRRGFAIFAKSLDILPVIVGKKVGMSAEQIDCLRKELNGARDNLVRNCGDYLVE